MSLIISMPLILSERRRLNRYSLSCSMLASQCLHISYAFTRSDFKTVVFPVLCYGLMASPSVEFRRIPLLILWIWIHLLQFTAANQMLSHDEDALNKPYRPIPAGLITTEQTRVLRWVLVPICLFISVTSDVFYPGLSLAVAFIAYNELGLDNHWFTKNLLNAIGLVSWNIGAANISSGGQAFKNEECWVAPYFSAALIISTIHIQDFRDVVGDRKAGRTTFPIAMPEYSRWITFILLSSWSLGLSLYWSLGVIKTSIFVLFGVFIGTRILCQRTEFDDKVSLRLFMIWLCVSQILPFRRS
ncbi:UbiA prenyltransferase family-domain-containing protein [Mycena galericulata]|nr:UbiA prenyltransferase family-domain-containing protein [Mycena galericulata]KAJ7477305.1 UbiA prenyltransferase family-domain-containing protein [Mycena galericulata]